MKVSITLAIIGVIVAEFVSSQKGVGYLIMFGSVVAFSAYTWLLQHCSPTLVATHTFVNPLVAVLAGWLWASEPMSFRIVLATTVILVAIVLIQRGDRHAEMQAESVPSD